MLSLSLSPDIATPSVSDDSVTAKVNEKSTKKKGEIIIIIIIKAVQGFVRVSKERCIVNRGCVEI